MKKRDRSIDFLMFIAILLVVNSHIEEMYVNGLKCLSTGGVIGDALFFFCSGYKLFISRCDRFDEWYRRRVARIYPTVLVWDIIAGALLNLPFSVQNLFDGWVPAGYWFIKCIMFHYVLLYVVRRYLLDYLSEVMAFAWIVVLTWWCVEYSPSFAMAMLGASKFEWGYMFIYMLLGGVMALKSPDSHYTVRKATACLALSCIGHYGCLYMTTRYSQCYPIRIMFLLPLTGIILSLHHLSRTTKIIGLMNSSFGTVIAFLGGLCLEVYITSPFLETDSYNRFFPLNVIVFFVCVFMVAYVIRIITRFVLQTCTSKNGYDYRSLLGV